MLALRPATTKERVQKLVGQPESDQEKASQSQPWVNSAHTPVSVSMNILPCRIHHDGPVEVSKRYWNPVNDGGADNSMYITNIPTFILVSHMSTKSNINLTQLNRTVSVNSIFPWPKVARSFRTSPRWLPRYVSRMLQCISSLT